MRRTGQDVDEFIAQVVPAVRRRDAATLVDLMRRVTGEEPEMWHPGIVGFGLHHYDSASGGGQTGAAGFAPRRPSTVVYLAEGIDSHADALSRLGPHTTGRVCLYLKNLDDIDLAVLEDIVRASYETVTAAEHGQLEGR
ncbi:DUF1801 domain-containing protein [Microbacterium sp. BWT-B31]|uniref:DUF1801 domain-containing protein n=1 Tax=Microbacterium sp. BWT-B31 TaxID=3232072 RepID=UPI003528B0CB